MIFTTRGSYSEGDIKELTFNSLDELLQCEYVSRWNNNIQGKFHRFSIGDYTKDLIEHYEKQPLAGAKPQSYLAQLRMQRYVLMVEFEDGYEWYVIGYLNERPEGLPEFKCKYKPTNKTV